MCKLGSQNIKNFQVTAAFLKSHKSPYNIFAIFYTEIVMITSICNNFLSMLQNIF